MKIKAIGQLQHKFHGTYRAVVALQFATADDAAAALPVLGAGWKQSTSLPIGLVWAGESEALDVVKETLGKFGARDIDSIAKSIDYGPKFRIEIAL